MMKLSTGTKNCFLLLVIGVFLGAFASPTQAAGPDWSPALELLSEQDLEAAVQHAESEVTSAAFNLEYLEQEIDDLEDQLTWLYWEYEDGLDEDDPIYEDLERLYIEVGEAEALLADWQDFYDTALNMLYAYVA